MWYDSRIVPSRPGHVIHSFGPGALTPAVKTLLWTNIGIFLVSELGPKDLVFYYFGFSPSLTFGRFWLWQPVTYMFLHDGLGHILFNMLMLWMFGVELERRWGTEFFAKYYVVCGLGAAATMVLWSFLPFGGDRMYASTLVGASGALYGLLLAYGLIYPDRPIYMYFLFPIPAKYFVMIVGAIAFLLSVNGGGGGGTAHMAHLGGIAAGYLYLTSGRHGGGLIAEIKYRYLRWKMDRMRRRFGVHDGRGGGRWDRNVH